MTEARMDGKALTESMRLALDWLKERPRWHKNWTISGVSMNTLEALYRRGLVERRGMTKWSFEYKAKEPPHDH